MSLIAPGLLVQSLAFIGGGSVELLLALALGSVVVVARALAVVRSRGNYSAKSALTQLRKP